VVTKIGEEYGNVTGRTYRKVEPYKIEDADIGVLVLGSTAGTARVAVKAMREKGIKVGLIKVRLFRPFPIEEIKNALKGLKAVAVMDRSDSFGAFGGPVFSEVRSALLGEDVEITNYIYGLGGRDIRQDQIEQAITETAQVAKTKKVKCAVNYLGVR
jgi:pyruvate ferredoxin oxidoreductase alpha subunit